MPRRARFRIHAIETLLRQLEYAPEAKRQQQMEAAERLIADLDPKQNYPEDFIVFRITGYRPDSAREPVTFVGEALMPDLVTLVQTLSDGLNLKAADVPDGAMTLDAVAEYLRVSPKTVQRYRIQGLACRFLVFDDGVKRLACTHAALQRFTQQHGPQLQKAAAFSRVNGQLESELIAQARAMHESERCSLNEAALRLSKQIGRAHETVRMILRRHDRRASQPIFSEHGPLTERDVHVIHRAWLRGLAPSAMASHYGKSKPTVNRAVNQHRAELLRSWPIAYVDLPTLQRPDAETVILSSALVRTGLPGAPHTDALSLIDSVDGQQSAGNAQDESSLIAAYNLLKRKVSTGIAMMGESATTEVLDMLETDLRWATLLKRRLVMMGLPAAFKRIQHHFQRPLREQATEELIELLKTAIDVARGVIDTIDPSRGQQLHRLIALAMDKALAKSVIPQMTGRASARHSAGHAPMRDPFHAIDPWSATLNLRSDLHQYLGQLESTQRAVLETRFGLRGVPPMTCITVARTLKLTTIVVTRTQQQAILSLRTMARTQNEKLDRS